MEKTLLLKRGGRKIRAHRVGLPAGKHWAELNGWLCTVWSQGAPGAAAGSSVSPWRGETWLSQVEGLIVHSTRHTERPHWLSSFPTDCACWTRPGFLSARLVGHRSRWLLQCKPRRPSAGFLSYLKQYHPITLHNCTGVRTFWLLFHLLAIILKRLNWCPLKLIKSSCFVRHPPLWRDLEQVFHLFTSCLTRFFCLCVSGYLKNPHFDVLLINASCTEPLGIRDTMEEQENVINWFILIGSFSI